MEPESPRGESSAVQGEDMKFHRKGNYGNEGSRQDHG